MIRENARRVAGIIGDAGGGIVGRTRLQKIAYLLDAAGYGEGFSFRYKHFGTYSDELALAARSGVLLGELRESGRKAAWGGVYLIYRVDLAENTDHPEDRIELAGSAAGTNAIELELAATAVFLARDGFDNPWEETKRRKPQKSDEGRLERAKDLLNTLSEIQVPSPLPRICS